MSLASVRPLPPGRSLFVLYHRLIRRDARRDRRRDQPFFFFFFPFSPPPLPVPVPVSRSRDHQKNRALPLFFMLAGSSAGGDSTNDYVWIKLATAKEDVFAKVTITSSDLVTDVAERSCAKFPRWRLDAGQVQLFKLAEAGPKPQVPAPEEFKGLEPLAEEATLESVGVASKSWLVALSTTPGTSSSSGGSGDLGASWFEHPLPP